MTSLKKLLLFLFSVIVLLPIANGQWEPLKSGTQNALNGIYFVDKNVGYTCGRDGLIFKTLDGGNHWVKKSSGNLEDLNATFFINQKIGYIVGRNGLILKTIDGGERWEKQNSGITYELNSVFFVNANVGYVACSYGAILKTTDGGATWSLIQTKTTPFISSVYFLNADTGYAVNSYGQILKTKDGGKIWEIKQTGTTRWLHAIHFPDANTGYAVGSGGIILKTNDGGKTWNFQTSGIHYELYSVYFTSATKGYAVSHFAVILKTENGGETWEVDDSFLTSFLTSRIGFKGDYTSDEYLEASTWSIRNECHGLYSMCFPDANTGYVCGHNGTILKLKTESQTIESIENITSKSPLIVYPNPATETVNITINHIVDENTTINIYNILGNIIYSEKLKQPKTQINIRDFSAGVYLVEVKGTEWSEKVKLVVQ
ncbi:MAG: YCF48-related protein [Bacteroidota bacterium]